MTDAAETAGQPSWGPYLDALVDEHGSLVAIADRLAGARGHAEDLESILRALRRLRSRGTRTGGKWGTRLLREYGLPMSVDARLRFMGSYHSRFVDLPVSLCADLVSLWDRPPTSESRPGRLWLSLARGNLALRIRHLDDAARHFAIARAITSDPAGRIETAMGQAFLDSRAAPAAVPEALEPIPGWLASVTGPEKECLRARYVGQLAHAYNHAGRFGEAETLFEALPDGPTVHPFARARRANGLAYARFKRSPEGGPVDPRALEYARDSARHAGDAGHVRLRAMALLMIARVARGTPEADEARERARQIANSLEDDTLRLRAERS